MQGIFIVKIYMFRILFWKIVYIVQNTATAMPVSPTLKQFYKLDWTLEWDFFLQTKYVWIKYKFVQIK